MTIDPELAIVLTAAIIVSGSNDAVAELAVRRQQYLTALQYYSKFAPVYFLENSGYDILSDAEFTRIPGVRIRSIAAHENESLGKGYREFHSLDTWYQGEKAPPGRIIKITGRYVLDNISDLLAECRAAAPDVLLIDRHRPDAIAVTSLFSLSWTSYEKYLLGLYLRVNDPQGVWIEHVVFSALAERNAKCRVFKHEPDISGISGSSGLEMRSSRKIFLIKQALRKMSALIDDRFIYFRGTSFSGVKKVFHYMSK